MHVSPGQELWGHLVPSQAKKQLVCRKIRTYQPEEGEARTSSGGDVKAASSCSAIFPSTSERGRVLPAANSPRLWMGNLGDPHRHATHCRHVYVLGACVVPPPPLHPGQSPTLLGPLQACQIHNVVASVPHPSPGSLPIPTFPQIQHCPPHPRGLDLETQVRVQPNRMGALLDLDGSSQ